MNFGCERCELKGSKMEETYRPTFRDFRNISLFLVQSLFSNMDCLLFSRASQGINLHKC